MKYSTSELFLIWLDSFLTLEYKHKKTLYEYIKDKKDIYSLLKESKESIVSEIGLDRYGVILSAANQTYLDRIVGDLEREQVKAITIGSKDYPKTLINTSLPPLVLYCKGDTSLLNANLFAMVGSRKNLPFQLNTAKAFASDLIDAGFTLVTGIAEGVDKEVLLTSLKKKAKVVSVIASGFLNIYPSSHKGLVDDVIKNGLVISEYPLDVVAKPYHFPIRNRIIAGLSKGVLIASGGNKSGVYYTAEYAEEYSKHVFAVPHSVNVASGKACNELIKRGAFLADCSQDILEFYGLNVSKIEIELEPLEREIVSLLQEGDVHVEVLSQKLNKKVFELLPTLSAMEIKGIVVKNGLNTYGLKG